MNRRLILAASIVLSVLLIATALAANFWTSTSVHKTITVSTVSNLDGAIISVESFNNYNTRTVPINFPENHSDVRDNSFLVGINNTNIAGDINITISATGVPPGMVVTAKMGYAAYWTWINGFDYPESNIVIFFENETGLGAYSDSYDGITQSTIWQPLNMSAYPYASLALDVPYTIPAAHVPAATLDSSVPLQSNTSHTFDKCNGLWLQFQFDTSSVSDGTYDIYVTVSLDPA
jgi:hypothetical protein